MAGEEEDSMIGAKGTRTEAKTGTRLVPVQKARQAEDWANW